LACARATRQERKLPTLMREPMSAFCTLAFRSSLGTVDVSTPGYVAMIVGTTGMIGLPITLASYRERAVLVRPRWDSEGMLPWSRKNERMGEAATTR
jgi:hypothetical protein